MSMSKIYVSCGGSSTFNGIYVGDNLDTTFTKPEDQFGVIGGIYLTNNGTTWQLFNSNNAVLYSLSTSINASLPVSDNSWSVVSGVAPAIQTYEFITGNTAISIVIANAWSPVNGTYIWSNSISVGGGVGTVSGYYKGSGVNLTTIYWATNMWKIVNSAGTTLYNGNFAPNSSTTPPVSNYSGTEAYWSGVGSFTETPTSTALVTCATSENASPNFFIGYSNTGFLSYNNSMPYIRKS